MKQKRDTAGNLFAMLSLFVVIVLFAGCTGQQQGPSGTPQTPVVSGPVATTVKETSGNSFSSIFGLGKPVDYTVDYNIAVTDDTGKETTMQQTHNVKGEKIRIDTNTIADGQNVEMRVYSIPLGGYICTKAEGAWTCLGGKSENELEGNTKDAEDKTAAFEGDMGNVAYDGTQNIAGVTANCYKYTYGGESVRMCLHPNKYLALLVEGKGYKMTATRVSLNSPDESVFELPAEPVDLGSSGSGTDACSYCNLISDADAKAQCLASC